MGFVLNLFGPPGTGKSTTAAQVFARLKWAGVDCELTSEYAKWASWENNAAAFDDPVKLFSENLHQLLVTVPQCDVVVCDSPLLSCAFFNRFSRRGLFKNNEFWNDRFSLLVEATHAGFDNVNVLLKRTKPYNPKGRVHTEAQSNAMYDGMRDMLLTSGAPFFSFDATPETADKIFDITMKELDARKENDDGDK